LTESSQIRERIGLLMAGKAGNDLLVPEMTARGTPDTVFSMVQPNAIPTPPDEPAWDITFTRVTQTARPQVDACARDLARRFQVIGVGSDTQTRQTPRGLSTFLALVGRRGLICIVDMTLVDGMAVGQGPCAALDIRLLDACGDVVADGLADLKAGGVQGRACNQDSATQVLTSESLDRAATAVYTATLAQFDLLRPVARCG